MHGNDYITQQNLWKLRENIYLHIYKNKMFTEVVATQTTVLSTFFVFMEEINLEMNVSVSKEKHKKENDSFLAS